MILSPRVPPQDAPVLIETDGGFTGFRSRVQPAELPPGVAAYLENMRCERGSAKVRKGTKALATDLELDNPVVALDFDLPTEIAVSSITRSGTTATVTTATAHGFSTGDVVGIEGADQPEYNGDPEITVTDTDEFTYTVSGSPATPATGTIVTAKGPRIFDVYDDGVRAANVYADRNNVEGIVMATSAVAYVYREGEATAEISYPPGETAMDADNCHIEQFMDKVYLFRGYQTADRISVSSITRSGTTATATTATDHGLATGEWVTVVNATPDGYNGIVQVTVTGATTFTYTVDGALATPATGTITARPCKPPLVWDGDTANDFAVITTGPHATGAGTVHMPAADWGVQFTRRLVLPYSRDEIILSDFGDADTFDAAYAQLRIMPGGNDWLVGAVPYQNRGLIVLYRKSVHLVYFQTTDPAPSGVQEVTRDYGCAARRSAANCGDMVLWLSDQGVTGVKIDFNLNIVPLSLPLSDTIQDVIDRINWAHAGNVVARFWNNRYYLAVPLDDSTTNNAILVFNFLNRRPDALLGEWESVDTFTGSFDVREFCVLDYDGKKQMHVVTSPGWVFVMETLEADEWGTPGSDLGTYPIAGVLHSRDYRFGTLAQKRYQRVQIESNVASGDAFSVTFEATNPDSSETLLSYTADATTGVSHQARTARQRGVSGSIEITTSAGRPEFRTVSVEARSTDRVTITRT